jgi:hypothetical protein
VAARIEAWNAIMAKARVHIQDLAD